MLIFDAAGLALFAVAGAGKALDYLAHQAAKSEANFSARLGSGIGPALSAPEKFFAGDLRFCE